MWVPDGTFAVQVPVIGEDLATIAIVNEVRIPNGFDFPGPTNAARLDDMIVLRDSHENGVARCTAQRDRFTIIECEGLSPTAVTRQRDHSVGDARQ